MVEQREILQKRLEAVNKQISSNIIIAIICILVLVFVPVMKFENFRFEFSLEVIIAFFVLIFSIFRGFTIRSKKEDIEAELSVYSKDEVKKEEKKEARKEPEPEFICEYCDKKFKSEDALNKHYDGCEAKKIKSEKDTKTVIWVVSVLFFVGLGISFLINNKINLIPLFLIGFIATPFFDKLFNHYNKKSNRLKHFEINWWKKVIAILTIIFIFVIINWLIPECPKSCNDNNSCTNDFCSAETGYKCMNTLKLNCKGNGICESGEYGTSDCPNCDDNNKCSADSYDSASKQCIHTEMKGCVQ